MTKLVASDLITLLGLLTRYESEMMVDTIAKCANLTDLLFNLKGEVAAAVAADKSKFEVAAD